MGWFKKSPLPSLPPTPVAPEQHAVIVHLQVFVPPSEVGDALTKLEDQLKAAVEGAGVGEFDGNEVGQTDIVLFMYGADGERMFEAVEPILRASPLCKGARVQVRPGGPDTPTREVRL